VHGAGLIDHIAVIPRRLQVLLQQIREALFDTHFVTHEKRIAEQCDPASTWRLLHRMFVVIAHAGGIDAELDRGIGV
jgi:hypothetical protein